MTATGPIARFYQMIEGGLAPQRADKSAGGTLPVRAYRYCDAVTSAAGFGWWVFPPANLQLLWDGEEIFWHCDGLDDWVPLLASAQFPGQSARFDLAAPPALCGCSPPFLSALADPGVVQIWTGLMVRSAPGWSLLGTRPCQPSLCRRVCGLRRNSGKRPPFWTAVHQHPFDANERACPPGCRSASGAGAATATKRVF